MKLYFPQSIHINHHGYGGKMKVGFLSLGFVSSAKNHARTLQWNEMDRDIWLVEIAVKDAAITFFWITCTSMVSIGANLMVEDLKLNHDMAIVFVAGSMFALLPMFLNLACWMKGACWNTINLVAFAYMGDNYNRHTMVSIVVRLLAQIVAAVYAAVFVMRFVPLEYKHMVGGPTLQVDPLKGILVEGILTYILTMVSLINILRGPYNPRMRQLIGVVATFMLTILGGAYTGPSMNPTCSYGWAVVNEQNKSGEHYVVYWMGPFIGALAAVKTVKLFGPKLQG